ncbi:MAG: polyprenyl synthetase family protein [Nitrososphaerota archaeon]
MKEQDILAVLAEYSKRVDEIMEQLAPKEFKLSYLERFFGKPRYAYETQSLTDGISRPFWDLLGRGGKRWRPALTILTYEALGGTSKDILEFAAIPEIIHNATLIVDDVEDGSLMRRGAPCIHRIYGVDIAVNAGNALYYIPVHVLLRKLDPQTAAKLSILDVEHMVRLSLGQTMEIVWHRGLVDDVSVEQYLQMCALKTGSMSRLAVELACIAAGCGDEVRRELGEFGESIGVAFQIQDDLLNLFGEERKYGKEVGGDITEGKKTILTVYAMRHLQPEDAARLKEILAMHTQDGSLIAEAIELVRRSGADKYAREVAVRILSESWAVVERLLKPSEARDKLAMLCRFLIERSM